MSLLKAASAVKSNTPEILIDALCEVAKRIASRRRFPAAFTVNGPVRPKLVLQGAIHMNGPVPATLAEAALGGCLKHEYPSRFGLDPQR